MKILYVDVGVSPQWLQPFKKMIELVKRPDVEVEVVGMMRGPPDAEYHYYEHLLMDELLEIVRKAEKERYDSVVIGCFYDPGLREAREIARIPIVGPAEACMHIASTLGHRFSIITGRRKFVPKMEDNTSIYGLEKKLASIRTVDFSVKEMEESREKLKEALLNEAKRAVEEDGAEVIVLGCTAESGFSKELMEKLKVPVIDATLVAWKYAEMMADLHRKLGITHSKIGGYESPPREAGWLE